MLKKTTQRGLILLILAVNLAACRVASANANTAATPASLAVKPPVLTAPQSGDACVYNTRNEGECKDCCDNLGSDGAGRKACRDACPKHDFSQNTNFIDVQLTSILGPDGDYSACTGSGNQGVCKECCDSTTALQNGDRRYCRDACNKLTDTAKPVGNPNPPEPSQGQKGQPARPGQTSPQQMNIEQAVSDEAQLNTIAFDALAFLTGDLGSDSFFPPGKVADFWGFQYLRDNDPSQMGHNTDFLTRASLNMLSILTTAQRTELITLAEGQVDDINQYGYKRFVLMDAFRRLLEGNLPSGSAGLNQQAVQAYSAELYQLDGQISLERAQVMGGILNRLETSQRQYLDAMVGKGMLDWPDVAEPAELRGMNRDIKVAVMTYAGDMYSWYAGSVEVDAYFCPERQGTYFGSFYLKDAPAVGNPNYTISSTLTADMGQRLLSKLTPSQAQLVGGLVDVQRPYLLEIVQTRRDVSIQLRRFMTGESVDSAGILKLMGKYGELDGTIVYNFATNFAQVNRSLSAEQKAQLASLRQQMLGTLAHPSGAYLYSQPIEMPAIPNSDFLFVTP